jgi:phenylpropionate dioxygenase-like ring-hydroxylating dioxygenase large terminal subunit
VGLSAPPRAHWYIAVSARALGRAPVGCTVLGEPLVLFSDGYGRPAALRDRCLHRNMALSAGRVVDGCLECPYHGWRYDGGGRCTAIPSFGQPRAVPPLAPLPAYPAVESDGYVWVFMGERAPDTGPFRFPHLDEPGWSSFRMRTRFPAGAAACLENFLDCPHTVFVHRGWFRTRDPRALRAQVRRYTDRVEVDFIDEPRPRSVVSALFFPTGEPLAHSDRFHMPAISRVDYRFGPDRHFIITSQCTPVSDRETMVYTVITFRFGAIAPLVRLLLKPLSRWIIRQDIAILARQTAQIERFGGPRFSVVETDLFARHIAALWRGRPGDDPSGEGRAEAELDRPHADVEVAIRF